MALSTSSLSSSSDDLQIDNTLDVYIKKRKEELQSEFNNMKRVLEQNHGKLLEIEEAVFLDSIKQSDIVVCHFFHPEFNTCKTLDLILEEITLRHLETKFIKINALEADFFVNKLKIRTLPTLCVFERGILRKKFLGFEEYGGENPNARLLQIALSRAGAITYVDNKQGTGIGSILGHHEQDDSDSF